MYQFGGVECHAPKISDIGRKKGKVGSTAREIATAYSVTFFCVLLLRVVG